MLRYLHISRCLQMKRKLQGGKCIELSENLNLHVQSTYSVYTLNPACVVVYMIVLWGRRRNRESTGQRQARKENYFIREYKTLSGQHRGCWVWLDRTGNTDLKNAKNTKGGTVKRSGCDQNAWAPESDGGGGGGGFLRCFIHYERWKTGKVKRQEL